MSICLLYLLLTGLSSQNNIYFTSDRGFIVWNIAVSYYSFYKPGLHSGDKALIWWAYCLLTYQQKWVNNIVLSDRITFMRMTGNWTIVKLLVQTHWRCNVTYKLLPSLKIYFASIDIFIHYTIIYYVCWRKP